MTKLLLCVVLLACCPCFRLGTATTTDFNTAATSETSTAEQVTTEAASTSTKSTATSGSTAFSATSATGKPTTNATEPTTKNMEQTTLSTDNTTTKNTTDEATTIALTTRPVTSLPPPPPPGRYAVNGSDGTCILMEFYLEVMITYNKTDGEADTKSIIYPDTSVPTGNCTDNSRYFSLAYPEFIDWYLKLDFNVKGEMFEMTSLALQWKYEEPFFLDAEKMGETDNIKLGDPKTLNVRADTGTTFKCKIREFEADAVRIIMEEIMYQPYADRSAEKGGFGDVELCAEDKPTPAPQGPADNTGMIVGIVLGSIAAVALIIGGLYFVMKRRTKRESYKSLD